MYIPVPFQWVDSCLALNDRLSVGTQSSTAKPCLADVQQFLVHPRAKCTPAWDTIFRSRSGVSREALFCNKRFRVQDNVSQSSVVSELITLGGGEVLPFISGDLRANCDATVIYDSQRTACGQRLGTPPEFRDAPFHCLSQHEFFAGIISASNTKR